jgi:hypothetical protein
VQAPPAPIYERLVEARTTVPIKGLPEPTRADLVLRAGRLSRPDVREWAARQKVSASYELTTSSSGEEAELRALMYSDDLAKHCRKIKREAELAIEETGANMLHVVIGFLEYPDQKDSDRVFLAPLISIPVSLGRKDHSGGQTTSFSTRVTTLSKISRYEKSCARIMRSYFPSWARIASTLRNILPGLPGQ